MHKHYYSEEQISPSKPNRITALLRGYNLEFNTDSGVFSKTRIDPGSAILIKSITLNGSERFLDLGCGYGPVGIAIAKSEPSAEIVMTDINKRAVRLANRNLKENSITNAIVVQGNLYENVEGSFDIIATNPPQSAGKELCLEMINQSLNFLKEGGIFYFVARHRKGGKSLSEHLESVFGNLETIEKKSGYRVYSATKRE